jgi:hypothetical protein
MINLQIKIIKTYILRFAELLSNISEKINDKKVFGLAGNLVFTITVYVSVCLDF